MRSSLLLLPLLLPLPLSSQSLPFLSGVGKFQQQARAYQCVEAGNKLVFCGWTGGHPGNADASLTELDADGDTIWIRHYTGSGNEHARGMVKTSTGGFIMGGFTTSFGAGGEDMLMIRTDANGDTLFTRTFGSPQGEAAWNICSSSAYGGGFIFCGYTSGFGNGGKDILLIRTDMNGTILWSKTYGGPLDEEGYDVIETPSKELIVTGYGSSLLPDSLSMLVLKIDSSGNQLWVKFIGNTYDDYGKGVTLSSDGNILVAGYGKSGSMYEDAWLVKFDQMGNTLWKKYYGGPMFDSFYELVSVSDGGICAVGYTNFFGGGGQDALIMRLDSNGDTLWTKVFGGTGCDEAYGIHEAADSNFVLYGYEQSFFSGTRTMFLARLEADGSGIPCHAYQGPMQYGTLVSGDFFGTLVTGNAALTSGYAPLEYGRGDFLDRFCSPGGVWDEEITESVALYPNPTRDHITIRFSTAPKNSLEATMYKALGETVRSFLIHENNLEQNIDLGGLPAGIYLMKIGDSALRFIIY